MVRVSLWTARDPAADPAPPCPRASLPQPRVHCRTLSGDLRPGTRVPDSSGRGWVHSWSVACRCRPGPARVPFEGSLRRLLPPGARRLRACGRLPPRAVPRDDRWVGSRCHGRIRYGRARRGCGQPELSDAGAGAVDPPRYYEHDGSGIRHPGKRGSRGRSHSRRRNPDDRRGTYGNRSRPRSPAA